MTIITVLIGFVSALYATAGQAGGTGFLAVMVLASFPPDEMRTFALALNVVAAGYATLRLHRAGAVNWRLLRNLVAASVPAALAGGFIVLTSHLYSGITGCLLLAVSVLMMARTTAGASASPAVSTGSALLGGAVIGFASGLTGVGGGVFLAPILIFLGWASPKQAAGMSAPFILANSMAGMMGAVAAGQRVSLDVIPFAGAALVGSIIGTAIGLRWMSQTSTRYILALILLIAGGRLLAQSIF
jgi:uncharacterized membrane protein YfcA